MNLLFIFIVVPLIEVYLLIKIGSVIGAFHTVVSIVLTAVIGTYLLKKQGLEVLEKLKTNVSMMRPPIKEVFDGGCLLFAGALLLTPGFLTDIVGFLLLVPKFRDFLRKRTKNSMTMVSGINVHSKDDFYDYKDYSNMDSSNHNSKKDETIEVDYEEIKD